MKVIIAGLLMSALSFSAFAGVKTFYKTGIETYKVYDRFELDAFSNASDYTYCFTGTVLNICQELGYSEDQNVRDYTDGGHGYYELTDCNMISADRVNISVNIVTDYGDDDNKDYSIKRCTLEQSVE